MVWNSVTLYNAKGFTVIRTGMMMLVKYSGHIGNGSWDSVQCEYVLPAESVHDMASPRALISDHGAFPQIRA